MVENRPQSALWVNLCSDLGLVRLGAQGIHVEVSYSIRCQCIFRDETQM